MFRPLLWPTSGIDHRTANLICVHKELYCVVVASVRHYKVIGDKDVAEVMEIQVWIEKENSSNDAGR
jgi:hypothetical protein